MEKKKVIFIGLIILVLAIIGIVIYAIIRKKTIDKKAKIISDTISGGVGVLGTDVDSLLVNISPANFRLPEQDLKKLKDADGGTFGFDHPEYINQVLKGKSKAQIKAIFNQFQQAYSLKFNDHLNKIFDDITGYDTKGYQSVMDLIKNAA